MWDNMFDIDMLEHSDHGLAVNCPEEELEREFAALLDEHSITYPNGESVFATEDVWRSHCEDFCYYIKGKTTRRGPKSSTDDFPWNGYEKCTFYGEQREETEIDENSFCSILMN